MNDPNEREETQRQDEERREAQAESEGKKYYTPSEVRKEKGCIGCGGMILGLALVAMGIVITII